MASEQVCTHVPVPAFETGSMQKTLHRQVFQRTNCKRETPCTVRLQLFALPVDALALHTPAVRCAMLLTISAAGAPETTPGRQQKQSISTVFHLTPAK